MVRYTNDLFKKVAIISIIIFFIFSVIILDYYFKNQSIKKETAQIIYSLDMLSQMFSQEEIAYLIKRNDDYERKFLLEKTNIILKGISKELNLPEDSIFIASKKDKKYYINFMVDKAPKVKGIKTIDNISDFYRKRFKNSDNENLNYYIFISKKIREGGFFLTSVIFSFLLTLIFLITLLISLKIFTKDFHLYSEIDNILVGKDDESVLIIKKDEPEFIIKLKEVFLKLHSLKKEIHELSNLIKREEYNNVLSLINRLHDKIKEQESKKEEINFYLQKIKSISKENDELIAKLGTKNYKEKLTEFSFGINELNKYNNRLESGLPLIDETIKKAKTSISLLEEISERSHLLSINAKIEATSENENKRFSIVAGEIRKMAMESKEMTNKIEEDFSVIKKLFEETFQETIENIKELSSELLNYQVYFDDYVKNQITIENNIKSNSKDGEMISQKIIDSFNGLSKDDKDKTETINQIIKIINERLDNYNNMKSNIEQIKEIIDGVLKNEEK